jgi:hypothetical protein
VTLKAVPSQQAGWLQERSAAVAALAVAELECLSGELPKFALPAESQEQALPAAGSA